MVSSCRKGQDLRRIESFQALRSNLEFMRMIDRIRRSRRRTNCTRKTNKCTRLTHVCHPTKTSICPQLAKQRKNKPPSNKIIRWSLQTSPMGKFTLMVWLLSGPSSSLHTNSSPQWELKWTWWASFKITLWIKWILQVNKWTWQTLFSNRWLIYKNRLWCWLRWIKWRSKWHS